jgi:tripartite ATP-independent transporter DctM subunit
MTITIFVLSLLGAMALGVPIAFSLLICGVALMLHLNMFDAQILAQNLIEGSNSFPLLAVPFFMLAGEIMNAGGLSRRIVNFAMACVGHIKGGLGYVTIMAAVIMAALSGSAVADAAALASLLLPMMIAAGHDRSRSAGLIASAGIIAPVIPPSIGFVIFGVAGNVSISKLFMAGIVPGIMLGAALWVTWWWLARREVVQVPPRKSMLEIGVAMKEATWALVLPLIVVFGLKFGVFTPTEAAVVAAVYALFISTFIYKELSLKSLQTILSDHVNYPQSICSHVEMDDALMERQQTIASLLMDLTSRTMHVAWGTPCQAQYHSYALEASGINNCQLTIDN